MELETDQERINLSSMMGRLAFYFCCCKYSGRCIHSMQAVSTSWLRTPDGIYIPFRQKLKYEDTLQLNLQNFTQSYMSLYSICLQGSSTRVNIHHVT